MHYDCADNVHDLGNDEENAVATPFAKTGSNTFANRAAYFAPNLVDVQTGGYPFGHKGAVPYTADEGGSLIMPSRPNSLLRR